MHLIALTIRNILSQKQNLKEKYTTDHYAEVKERVHSSKVKEFMDELLSIVESQLSTAEMNIDYICIQMGMSRTKLYQKIKSITGESICDVRDIRLYRAVQMLTEQNVPLSEVIFFVGIQTQSYFTKAFKNKFGKMLSQFLKDIHR